MCTDRARSHPRRVLASRAWGVPLAWAFAAIFWFSAARPAWSQLPVDTLLANARDSAGRDEHAQAIRLYREALYLAPELSDSLTPALGAQLTWGGHLEEAIVLFTPYLERHRERIDVWKIEALAQAWSGHTDAALRSYRAILAQQSSDGDARFGEARMLSWLGRTTEAVHRYEALLRDEPDHRDARLQLAIVHNWRGDHEKAARYFDALARETESTEAWEGLAWARQWGGRSNEALEALQTPVARNALSESGLALRERIHADWIPRVSTSFDHAVDSDDFTAGTWRVEGELPISYRAHLRAGVLQNRFTRDDRPDVEDTWALAAFDSRIARQLQWSSAFQLAFERPDGADYTPLVSDLGLAWLAGDRARLDLGYSHFAAFTYETLPNRITGDLVSAGLTLRPHYLTTVILAGDRATYSDRNERWNARARARYRLLQRNPRLWLEAGAHSLDFERQPGHGLWTPEQYQAYFGRTDLELNPDGRLAGSLTLDGGWAREDGAEFTPYFSYSGGLTWRAGALRFDLRAGHSDSNVENGRGYRRSFGSIGVTSGF